MKFEVPEKDWVFVTLVEVCAKFCEYLLPSKIIGFACKKSGSLNFFGYDISTELTRNPSFRLPHKIIE